MYDSTIVMLLPAFLFAMWARYNVTSTFEKYSRVKTRSGATAAEVARMLLDKAGLSNVAVNRVKGSLTDNYDPIRRVINLSDAVYGSCSIASFGVAAHECGHAIQHKLEYSPLMTRNAIVPIVNIGSVLAMPLFFIGFIFSYLGLMTLGVILFSGVVIFHLITLPVEFNASSRALSILSSTGTLSKDELVGADTVLRAAAWTYIGATLVAVMHLLRFIILRNQQ